MSALYGPYAEGELVMEAAERSLLESYCAELERTLATATDEILFYEKAAALDQRCLESLFAQRFGAATADPMQALRMPPSAGVVHPAALSPFGMGAVTSPERAATAGLLGGAGMGMGAMSPAQRSATAALLGGVAMPGTALGLRGVEVSRRHAGFLDGLRGRPSGFPAAPATTGPAPWPPPPLPPPEQPPSPRTMQALLASSRVRRGRDDINLLDVM